jgi:hypothetical protein
MSQSQYEDALRRSIERLSDFAAELLARYEAELLEREDPDVERKVRAYEAQLNAEFITHIGLLKVQLWNFLHDEHACEMQTH